MNQTKHQKLQALIDRLEIIYPENRKTISIDHFQKIEKRLGCSLPDDYKYCCQQLGTGCASDFIRLYCINDENIDDLKEIVKDMVRRLSRVGKKKNCLEYIELLNSALIFGCYNSDNAIFWDLRTFNIEYGSCDIYWYDIYSPDASGPILIGRNFTDFLYDFCYGQLPCSLIPGYCVDGEQKRVEYTFAYLPYFPQSEFYLKIN
jgi:SMI1 / KNR4 family (SUKH-1)